VVLKSIGGMTTGIFQRLFPEYVKPDRQYLFAAEINQSSLLFKYGNIYSQTGQDGIIGFLLEVLGIENGFFCEFGAWDGVKFSNTRWLYEKGWSGLLIEPHSSKYKVLVSNYERQEIGSTIFLHNGFVGTRFDDQPRLHEILKQLCHREAIDLLVIDIDGYDLEVFEATSVQPSILVIEGGTNIAPNINAQFPYSRRYQHSLAYINSVMESRGYGLVCFLQDSYYVRRDLIEKARINLEIRTPEEVFYESFIFRGSEFCKKIRDMRLASKDIREFETSHLGFFEPDPLILCKHLIRKSSL